VGKGGFGEVYLAYSDGGKEVALKLICGHTAVELRGIAHCLNLKHPNLVHLYDLRFDEQKKPWLVMEFILGESLAQIVQRSANGLPEQMVREWFLSYALGLHHLHDRGIVHRDLKPGNVFIENGHLKIGDYGLCKTITDAAQGHTTHMGTVHYMAPEIGQGNYTRSIDIYSSGIMLYELLLGRVPFNGQSVGEIIIKHMTDQPDVSMIPPRFQPIVLKSLEKSPENRYATIQEMARDIERLASPLIVPVPRNGPQPVDSLVVKPTPEVVLHGPQEPRYRPVPPPPPPSNPPLPSNVVPESAKLPPPSPMERFEELAKSMLAVPILLLPVVGLSILFTGASDPWGYCRFGMLVTLFIWSILIVTKLGHAPVRWHRFALVFAGVAIGTLHIWSIGWTPTLDSVFYDRVPWHTHLRPVIFFALVLGVLNWSEWISRTRESLWSSWPVVIATGFGWFLWLAWRDAPPGTPWIPAIAAAIVQFVSPWHPLPVAPKTRKLTLRSSYSPAPSDTVGEFSSGMSVPRSTGD